MRRGEDPEPAARRGQRTRVEAGVRDEPGTPLLRQRVDLVDFDFALDHGHVAGVAPPQPNGLGGGQVPAGRAVRRRGHQQRLTVPVDGQRHQVRCTVCPRHWPPSGPDSSRDGGDAVGRREIGDQTDQESRSAGHGAATSLTAVGHHHSSERARPRRQTNQRRLLDDLGAAGLHPLEGAALHVADSHDLIRVQGARENNLKDVSVEIPKSRLTVFTGVSGAGKRSLVFGTIAAESQRLINEGYSAFVQRERGRRSTPLEGLTTAIIVDQPAGAYRGSNTVHRSRPISGSGWD